MAREQRSITWDDVEPAHKLLVTALGNLDHFLKQRGDLSESAAFRQGFIALNHGVESALNVLTLLHNRLMDEASEPRYVVEQDGMAFYVVDTRPEQMPGEKAIVLSSTSEENARHAADQLNAGRSLADLEDVPAPSRFVVGRDSITGHWYVRDQKTRTVVAEGYGEYGDAAAAAEAMEAEVGRQGIELGREELRRMGEASEQRAGAEEADTDRGARVVRVTAQVDIEDGQEGRYVVGEIAGLVEPWWVVDCAPNATPVSVGSFVDRADAIALRDALNVGDTDRARDIVVAEDLRREAAASEEEG